MRRLQAFKYELQATGEQRRRMCRYAGSCRFVYNRALALQKDRHERAEKKLGYPGLCKALTEWRHAADTLWLKDSPTHPLQQALKDLERAYSNFFARRAAFPRFKKKGRRDSFRYPDPKQIKLDPINGRIFLPKLGWLRYHNSREVLGQVRQVTVSAGAGKWFVSIQTAREVERPVCASPSAIGVDMGIARFATLSEGRFLVPRNSLKRHESALRKAQQSLCRKQKFSHNWRKAKAKVQRLHIHIGNVRRDFLHKATTAISKSHAMVCLEDLQVKNMSRSAAGTADVPGRNVRVKSGLNKAILDQGWFEFRRQLAYKLSWSGGELLAVPPQDTSRRCPVCDSVSTSNRVTQARFHCVACGFAENADLVGAINILSRGIRKMRDEGLDTAGRSLRVRIPRAISAPRVRRARIACEVSGAGRQQQEPAEVI